MRPGASPSLGGRWDALGRPFPHLPRLAAALVLTLLTAVLVWSVLATAPVAPIVPGRTTPTAASPQAQTQGRAKGDMALYARIAARVAAGNGYYAAAIAEHRASHYPTRPFVTVRLPTLAWWQAAIGADAVRWFALGLAVACVAALNRRPALRASLPERYAASALLALGGGAALSPVAGFDHDFIAGMLLTLALFAYRPGGWWPALLATGAALAVRELAAPFAALWLALALADRRWREAAAVAGLLGLFAVVMAVHANAVEALRLPGDLASQGWNARAGYGLPITALWQLTGLRFLPEALAVPLAILPLVGWAAVGGRAGLFAVLWFTGLATMMALFARPANYYWAELALPAYAVGLAFAPRGLAELVRSTIAPTSRQI